jgi:hypothetical protein
MRPFQPTCALLTILLTGALWHTDVLAQSRAKKTEEPVRVRKLQGLGSQARVRTPEFRTSASGSTKPRGEWAQVSVTYDTRPEWIDELVFQYHALAETRDPRTKRKVYSLYRTTVRYVDVKRDRRHMSTVFLHPRAVERYGKLVAVAVEISVGGKVVAEESETGIKMPDRWWKNPAVTDSKDVTARTGYLLNRAQSPWALINMDDYEVIR